MDGKTFPNGCRAALEKYLNPALFQALCDPRRLALLARLAVEPEPMTVGRAASCCGGHLSGVSRHLSILKRAGIVTATKVGREVSYQLESKALVDTLRGLADAIESCTVTPNPNEKVNRT